MNDNNANHMAKLAKQTTNYAGKPTGRLCEYCGERKHHSLFPMRKTGRSRDVICLDCLPRIKKARIEWAKIACSPVNGERYHQSVARAPKILAVKIKRKNGRVECDYGSGVSMRGVA